MGWVLLIEGQCLEWVGMEAKQGETVNETGSKAMVCRHHHLYSWRWLRIWSWRRGRNWFNMRAEWRGVECRAGPDCTGLQNKGLKFIIPNPLGSFKQSVCLEWLTVQCQLCDRCVSWWPTSDSVSIWTLFWLRSHLSSSLLVAVSLRAVRKFWWSPWEERIIY